MIYGIGWLKLRALMLLGFHLSRSFIMDEYLEVVGAEMVNGMLKVSIERIVPPEKQPRKIAIGVVPVEKEPQLLME